MKTLLHVQRIFPITHPPSQDAAIVFDASQILAIGPSTELVRQHPDAAEIDARDCVLLPGFVNAHTHLELSALTVTTDSPRQFVPWILSLAPRLMTTERTREQSAEIGTRLGVSQCLKFGVTCVGDIAQSAVAVRTILRDGPIRSVSFGESLGIGKNKPRSALRLAAAIDDSLASPLMRIGLSPHAPYSLDLDDWRRCMQVAKERKLPLASHLAETTHEAEFLLHHAGDFRTLLESLQVWEESIETLRVHPMQFAKDIGLLEARAVLAHVNYCTDAELDLLATGNCSVAYCPRTHLFFDHPPHRFREMLARGINVCLATDSCASSPDLNLLDDLRLVHTIAPDIPVENLFELITINGARALGLDNELGSIEVGKRPDFVLFPTDDPNPLQSILSNPILPAEVWISGKRVLTQT